MTKRSQVEERVRGRERKVADISRCERNVVRFSRAPEHNTWQEQTTGDGWTVGETAGDHGFIGFHSHPPGSRAIKNGIALKYYSAPQKDRRVFKGEKKKRTGFSCLCRNGTCQRRF